MRVSLTRSCVNTAGSRGSRLSNTSQPPLKYRNTKQREEGVRSVACANARNGVTPSMLAPMKPEAAPRKWRRVSPDGCFTRLSFKPSIRNEARVGHQRDADRAPCLARFLGGLGGLG